MSHYITPQSHTSNAAYQWAANTHDLLTQVSDSLTLSHPRITWRCHERSCFQHVLLTCIVRLHRQLNTLSIHSLSASLHHSSLSWHKLNRRTAVKLLNTDATWKPDQPTNQAMQMQSTALYVILDKHSINYDVKVINVQPDSSQRNNV